MNLRDLRYVVAVADLRHFGRAAERCHVSQPSLSKQVQKLEEYLGLSLFERSNRRVDVTPVGEVIIAHARAALHEADAMRDVARRVSDPLAGGFRLGIIPTLAPYLLPHCLPKLREHFPKLETIVREATTPQILQQLRHNELDAVIAALPLGESDLIEHPLGREPFLLAVPITHPLAKRTRVGLDDLEPEPLLLLEEGHCLRTQALSVCRRENRTGEFSATSLETLRHLVAAGQGVTLIPRLAAHGHQPDIRYVPFSRPVPERVLGIACRKSSSRRGLVEKMAGPLSAIVSKCLKSNHE